MFPCASADAASPENRINQKIGLIQQNIEQNMGVIQQDIRVINTQLRIMYSRHPCPLSLFLPCYFI